MLSILIPTYNYNVYPLVKEIHKQALDCNLKFEILTYDDGSESSFNVNNRLINLFEGCTFKELPCNIGRSAIRNMLAKDAKYESLLFLDARTFPKKKDFINNYIKIKNQKVINGGVTYLENAPKKPYKLRWLFTKKRENNFGKKISVHPFITSSNFLIKKEVFGLNPFDESLKKYGYEDLLFFDTLIEKKISIYCFNNPVIHNACDDANTFIKKTEHAIENLIFLIQEDKIKTERIGISKYYYLLTRMKLNRIFVCTFKIFMPFLKKNFNSSYPSIILYDFYRLGYFCLLKAKKQ
jgi:glycosyl transferase family 2